MMQRKDLIEKYLNGQLSEEEFTWLVNDLSQASDSQEYEVLLQQLWEELENASPLSPKDSQRLLVTFKNRRQKVSKPTRRIILSNIWYLAAAVSGILIVSVALWFFLSKSRQIEYVTEYGENRTITLPDSSTVTLNANSSLRFEPDWNPKEAREVWLDGEAYFSVRHTQNNQRFLVHVTDAVNVEVLGTEFNVKDRRDITQVVLNSGMINLAIQKDRAGSETLAMQPGDLVEFTEKDQTLLKKQVNPDLYSAWKDHKMIFDMTPLWEIAQQLEDTYGVSITIEDDSLASTLLTGAFPTQNLEMILTSLPTIISMKVIKEKNQIVFKEK